MSYTPNNLDVFTAAFSGAMAGMGEFNRNNTDSSPADYSDLASLAGAFAQQFDTRWGAVLPDGLQLDCIAAFSEGAWENRAPQIAVKAPRLTRLIHPYLIPATYDKLVLAIIAAIQAGENYYVDQGIPIPPPPETHGEDVLKIPFAFNTPSPLLLTPLIAGSTVNRVLVAVDTFFDDAGSQLRVGISTIPGLILDTSEINPSQAGQYENVSTFVFAVADVLQLRIAPGLSTQGSGYVLIKNLP
jgi:hypothetical protein